MILATVLVLKAVPQKKLKMLNFKKRLTRQTYSGIGVLVCSII